MPSLYDVLGVAEDATPEQIKEAYRRESMKSHPDRGGSEQRQRVINEAYEVLSTPERRAWYNKSGQTGPLPSKELEIQSTLIQFLTEVSDVLQEHPNINPLVILMKVIETKEQKMLKTMTDLKKRSATLKLQLRRVRRKIPDNKVNMFTQVFQTQIEAIEERLASFPDAIATLRAVRQEALGYESADPIVPQSIFGGGGLLGTSTQS